jgi:hypothetical protein
MGYGWMVLALLTTAPRGELVEEVRQRGAWRPLVSIGWRATPGGPIAPSAFDRGGYLALARCTSPDRTSIAFVGGRGGQVDGLYLLDLVRDEVRKLGPAPAPPPDPALRAICGEQPLEWGGCWADGLVTLEPEVLRYRSDRVLEASYAADRPAGRAWPRTTRRFELDRPAP